jgi:hypothetical protein
MKNIEIFQHSIYNNTHSLELKNKVNPSLYALDLFWHMGTRGMLIEEGLPSKIPHTFYMVEILSRK